MISVTRVQVRANASLWAGVYAAPSVDRITSSTISPRIVNSTEFTPMLRWYAAAAAASSIKPDTSSSLATRPVRPVQKFLGNPALAEAMEKGGVIGRPDARVGNAV